jgi:hypothetical protein
MVSQQVMLMLRPFASLRHRRWPALGQPAGQRTNADLGNLREGKVEDQKPKEIPQPPVGVRVFIGLGLGAPKFARVVDDVLNPRRNRSGVALIRIIQRLPRPGSA